MRAAVLSGVNEKVQIEERPDLIPGLGEAVVQIRAAALNHRDVWIRKGQYAGLKFPIVTGSDGVGSVKHVGEGVNPQWIGQDVIINPSLGWGKSEAAQDFSTFNILGLPHDGTFAEEVLVPAENLARVPAHFSDHEAAALPLAGLTAFRALFSRAKLSPGEKVLVTGVGGGAASFALSYAVAFGAQVYVTSSSDAKIADAVAAGASDGVSYRESDWDSKLKSMASGFDVIIDSAGGEGFPKLIDIANPGGRIVFFGATLGNPQGVDLRKIFWKQISLLGTTMGSPADFARMIDFVESHELRPRVSKVFSLDKINDALDSMQSGEQHGKIVVQI